MRRAAALGAVAVLALVLVSLGARAAGASTRPAASSSGPAPTGIDVGPPISSPPTTTPGGSVDAGSGADSPGFFDIGGRIRKGINDWFRDLVTSALNPALDALGQTVLATPQVTGPGRVRELWGMSVGIADACFGLLAVIGGAVVMSHESMQTRYGAKEVAPRLVIGIIAANASLSLAGQAIAVSNALSQALLGQGISPANATAQMKALVLGPLSGGGIFLVLVGGVCAVLALVLLAVYIGRVALMVVLVAGAPLALATHALPQTEGLARLWWRALLAVLGIQVAQALVLITALRVFFGSDGRATLGLSAGGLVDLLVTVCLLWLLVRIPAWASRAVFGRGSRGTAMRVARTYVVAKAGRAPAAAAAAAL